MNYRCLKCTALAVVIFTSGGQSAEGQADSAAEAMLTPEPPLLSYELEDRLAPGLILQLRAAGEGANQTRPDFRRARLATLKVPAGAPASPFVAPGPFLAVWRGYLYSELGDEVDFHLSGRGAAQLLINTAVVLEGNGDLAAAGSQRVQLEFGHNLIELRYATEESGAADVALTWSGDTFLREPLPPTVLFHDPEAGSLLEAQKIRHGRELFATHSCRACHQGWADEQVQRSMPELTRENPNLQQLGQRVQANWLHQWILNPTSLRNEVHMPAAPLGNDPRQRRQAAADLVAFLVAGDDATSALERKPESSAATDGELFDRGEILFETKGCFGCHAFSPPEEDDDYQRVTLHYAAAKYSQPSLIEYLLAPQQHAPWSRMPHLDLSRSDALALSVYIEESSPGRCETPPELANGDPARGERLFRSVGCAHCHQVGDAPLEKPALGSDWSADQMTLGCLAEEGRQSPSAPLFSFSADDREALAAMLTQHRDSLRRRVPQEVSERYVSALRCAVCHSRDGQANRLDELVFEESVTGMPPEIPPHLTWTGEKLQRDWVRQLVAGELPYRARPWMTLRMPQYPARAADLAEGLAFEHGIGVEQDEPPPADEQLVDFGRQLTLQAPRGFFCVQCHAVGDQPPAGAFDHKGVNFVHVAERLRREYYQRWMTDPVRLDPGSKMPKFSADGESTDIDWAL
ncbi:MAG: hypothetical protein AAF961_06550, partial [Planctomycetota bacterium]